MLRQFRPILGHFANNSCISPAKAAPREWRVSFDPLSISIGHCHMHKENRLLGEIRKELQVIARGKCATFLLDARVANRF